MSSSVGTAAHLRLPRQCRLKSQWSNIWSLNLPGKVRIFLWRLVHNRLPTRLHIKRKQVELDTRCPVSQGLDEDGGHLFLKCKIIKKVWRSLDIEDGGHLLERQNPVAMFEKILKLPSAKQKLIAVLLWDWWTALKKINVGDWPLSTEEVYFQISRHVREFSEEASPEALVANVHPRWEAPRRDYVKLNFDAAFVQSTCSGAWGYVIRDENGVFLAGGAGKIDHVQSALHAEAHACVAAMEGAVNLGANRVTFEPDPQVLVNA